MKNFTKSKKVLFGLATSLVLALAIGSFALSETQTPVTPQAAEPQNVATTNDTGDFIVTGGTEGENNDYHFDGADGGVLYIHPQDGSTNITISTVSREVNSRIEVTKAATITLSNADIYAISDAALKITDNAAFSVNLILDGQNILSGKVGDRRDNIGCPGLQKNGDTGVGKLTISGTGSLQAYGGYGAAGIGSGYGENESNIEITGGVIKADALKGSTVSGDVIYGAGIGSGDGGTGSNNLVDGDAVITGSGKIGLEQFTFTKGLVFEKSGDDESYSGTLYGDVSINESFDIIGDLTIPQGQTLTIGTGNTATVDDGVTLTNNGTLQVNGTLANKGTVNGNISYGPGRYMNTEINYILGRGADEEKDSIKGQDENGTKNYPELLSATKEGYEFKGWYTEPDGAGQEIREGDQVQINLHNLYAKWEKTAADPFKLEGQGLVEGEDYRYNGDYTLEILSDKNITIKNADLNDATYWNIEVKSKANLILNGVNIESNYDAPLKIEDNATFDVNIILADGSVNVLKSTVNACPGLQKGDDGSVDINDLGTLTINGNGKLEATGYTDEETGVLTSVGIGAGDSARNLSKIKITGGEIIANGGIGSFVDGNATEITITGGKITANGAPYCAGIGCSIAEKSTTTTASKITITGGEVTAIGGYSAAGIGSSFRSEFASEIKISGGKVTAYGGSGAAGIGGGLASDGNNIEITGGVVTAIGGYYEDEMMKVSGAGIGGGAEYEDKGKAANNKLDGDAVVLAACGSKDKEALQGFDSASGGSIARGIAFTGIGTAFDESGRTTDVNWEKGTLYGNEVTITEDVTFSVDLTIASNAALTVGENATLSAESGKNLIVQGMLKNNGTIAIPEGNLLCNGSGKITTLLNYDPQGGAIKTNDGSYITYQDVSGVKAYGTLPGAEKDGYYFGGWYNEKGGEGTRVYANSNVLLNEHTLYANWTTTPGPEPTPTPEPTPDPSVNPEGGGSSGASSKTSDPFMGGIALALLGVATTGAILTRRFR